MMRQRLQNLIANQTYLNIVLVLMSALPLTRGIALDLFALRTLRYGAKRSAQSLLWLSLFPAVMVALGKYYFALFYFGFSILPIYLMSAAMSISNNWQRVVEGLMLSLILVCLLIQYALPVLWFNFVTLPFIQQWQVFTEQWLQGKVVFSIAEVKQLLPAFFCIYIFSNIVHVFVARALQSWCFNPGGFKQELREFSLSWITLFVLTIGVIGSMLHVSFATLGAMLSVLPLALLGFMKLVAALERVEINVWLLPLLVLLVIVTAPYSFVVLVLTGLIDIILKYMGVSYASYFARKGS